MRGILQSTRTARYIAVGAGCASVPTSSAYYHHAADELGKRKARGSFGVVAERYP